MRALLRMSRAGLLEDANKLSASYLCVSDERWKSCSLERGISLDWVMDHITYEATDRLHKLGKCLEDFGPSVISALDLNFHQLNPVVAHGEHAFGFGKICPRDQKPHCSIVGGAQAHNPCSFADRKH